MPLAIESLEAATDAELSAHARAEKYAGLCTAYSRKKDFAAQADALSRWCRLCPDDPNAWTAEAIYSEHRSKDLARALTAAEKAYLLNPTPERSKRIERLNRRLGVPA